MKRLVLLFLLLISTLLANNEFTNDESSVFDQSNTNTQVEQNQVYYDSKNLYLSYIDYPKNIYKNQRFEVKIKALITRNNFDTIKTDFLNGLNMEPLNKDNKWEPLENVKNTYVNSFYFKSYEKNFKLPDIQVSLYNNGELVEQRVLKSPEINFLDVAKGDKVFSNVIAKDLTIFESKSKQYTNKEALTVIDIQAIDSNLEDFSINGFEEQGITLIEDEYPKQHMIYYVVIPIHTQSIIFSYFNTETNRLEKVIIPIKFDEELVSTQTDLNPNNSNFEFYKKIIVAVIALIFLILFIWKRKYLYLTLFLISLIFFIIFVMPNKTVKLKANSVIYILPTKNSTIFQKSSKQTIVEDMKRKNGFVKIMFKSNENKYIGWVKEEDVIKN
ncbi:MAG: hypothetical protein ACNI25_12950 [Halarcobacter sp.]